MKQRLVGATATAPSKPVIKEVKHPRLETAYYITKAAITGKQPEWELSKKEKIAYYALRYTVGRYIRNLRKAGETFRQTFYQETGIWIPGRLPREEEIRIAVKGTKKVYEFGRKGIGWVVKNIRPAFRTLRMESRGSWD